MVIAVQECPVGIWGSQCDKTCGDCEGGPEFCQVYDGRCFNGCGPGYHGQLCDKECPSGTHGHYCKHQCGQCSFVEPVCDVVTGECFGGCKPGYQAPFCKIACPYKTWGPGCGKVCDCPEKSSCGCHPDTGFCRGCDELGEPIHFVRTDMNHVCFNAEKLHSTEGEYVPKTALDIPWIPVLSFLGLIAFFVFTNFLYWLCFVRVSSKDVREVRVYRDKKPKQLKIQDWKTLYESLHKADRRLRIRAKAKKEVDKNSGTKRHKPGDIRRVGMGKKKKQ